MNAYIAEFFGTSMLVLLGNGVVANVVLDKTKGNNAGWIVITAGWGLAVFVAVACTAEFSGAHLNPAVTVGLAAAEKLSWNVVPFYVIAQMAGALIGAVLVYLVYQSHYQVSENADAKLATFCTAPAIRSLPRNLLSEVVGTFVLVFTVLVFANPDISLGENATPATIGLGSLGALPVGLVVFSIGLSLGGTTGYAINPARDLSPRVAHALLPIPGKGSSDWAYSWIPVAGPLAGGILAAFLFRVMMLADAPMQDMAHATT